MVFLSDTMEEGEDESEEMDPGMGVAFRCGAVALALLEKSKRMDMSSKSLGLPETFGLGDVPAPVTAPAETTATSATADCCCCCCSSPCSLSGCIPLPTVVVSTQLSADEVE